MKQNKYVSAEAFAWWLNIQEKTRLKIIQQAYVCEKFGKKPKRKIK